MRMTGIFLLIGLVFLSDEALADPIIGRIKQVEGIAYVQRGNARYLCKPGLALKVNDIVRTLDDGAIGFTLVDETSFALGPDTLVKIDEYLFDSLSYEGKLEASLEMGTVAIRTGRLSRDDREQIRIKTDQSILGVRGTYFLASS